MDDISNPNTTVAILFWLLFFILNASATLALPISVLTEEEEEQALVLANVVDDNPVCDLSTFMTATFEHFRLCASLQTVDDDLRFWVKPRSTTWLSRFLIEQYDNKRWVPMFWMTKPSLFTLTKVIRPHIEKKNTHYRLAVPVVVRVACTLFKLTHGANFIICSEMFALGRSTVSKVLREVVHAVNECLRHEISWPTGEQLRDIERKFNTLCSLPAVAGALDGMHISISKPKFASADYFYFKTGGYSINCQAVVDSEKRFLDLYVGMPGSTNDSRMLRRSSLYRLASHGHILDANAAIDGFSPYIIADSGYPLLPWLMVPHREGGELSITESLFNRKLKKGRCIVENTFGILKQSFRELLNKSDLKVTFLPDVVVCCAILHNILLWQSHAEIEEFLQVLVEEGLQPVQLDNTRRLARRHDALEDDAISV